jgi:hypothetical protein
LQKEAECVEASVIAALKEGFRTKDLAGPGEQAVSTAQMGAKVAEFVRKAATAECVDSK